MILNVSKNEDIIYISKIYFCSLDRYIGKDGSYRTELYDERLEGYFLWLVKNRSI